MGAKLVGIIENEGGKDIMTTTIEGVEVKVEVGQDEVRLADGRRARLKWVETFPLSYDGYEILEAGAKVRTLWKGKLAKSGRVQEPFDAELLRDEDGALHLVSRGKITATEVSPHEVSGEAWMRALAELAEAVAR